MATDVILVVHLLLLLVSVHATIDSILQEVEDRNERERLSHPSGKEVKRRGWDVYTVENSTDEYVKYQLDMIIKKDKLKSFLARKKPRRRNQRNAVEEDSQLWPKDIPYMIDDKFNQDQINNISNAIIHVMRHTCVDFWLMKEGQQEPQYIKFKKSSTGCNSEVGRTGHREQLINLEDSCLRVYVVAHEILHALGLYHEHMRHDRDKYVTIHRKNIKRGKKKDFVRLKEGKYRSFNKPYDYRSLMHYGKDSYGKTYNRTHKKVTIEPKQPEYLDVIGNAPGLSFYDIKILNSMYKCAAGCEKKRCPDETQFIGKNCECYCQGPPHDAAVLCDRPPESCYLDDGIVTGKYTVLHLPEFEELNVTNNPPVRSNTSIEIMNLDPTICGYHTIEATCNNGTWDRNLTLPCIQERCQLDPTWNNTYWMVHDEVPSVNTAGLAHNMYVDMVCLSDGNITTTLQCDKGIWKGQIQPCIEKCLVSDDLGDLDVMKITDADGKKLSRDTLVDSGVILEPTCNKGFEPRAGQTPQISCDRGNWTEIFICDERNCSTPDITDGTVYNWPRMSKLLLGKHVSRGDQVRVTCIEGYKIEGSATQDDTGIFTCDDGEWDQPINCVPKTCELTVGEGATYFTTLKGNVKDVTQDTVLPHDTEISISCGDGYELTDDTNAVTNETSFSCNFGVFDKQITCEKEKCHLKTIDHGEVRLNGKVYSKPYIEVGQQIKINCNKGYQIVMRKTIVTRFISNCRKGNKLTRPLPSCQRLGEKCLVSDDLGDLDVMKITDADGKKLSRDTLVDSGVILEPTCNKGFEPRAGQTPQISCDRGNWTEIFICDERNCSTPDIRDGTVYNWPRMSKLLLGKHVSRGDQVRVTCIEGYKIEGSATQDDTGIFTCDDGEWDQQINCVPNAGAVAIVRKPARPRIVQVQEPDPNGCRLIITKDGHKITDGQVPGYGGMDNIVRCKAFKCGSGIKPAIMWESITTQPPKKIPFISGRMYQERNNFHRTSLLIIKNMVKADLGRYRCRAFANNRWSHVDIDLTYGCADTHFECEVGRCIHRDRLCDGTEDCWDGRDEGVCDNCKANQFACDGGCIPKSRHCDGSYDCSDGSDEIDCRVVWCHHRGSQDRRLCSYAGRDSGYQCPPKDEHVRLLEEDGTDADVFLTLHGEHGDVSNEIQLTREMDRHWNLFETGDTDMFEEYLNDVGKIQKIRIRLSSFSWGYWTPYVISIYDFSRKHYYRFYITHWIKDNGGVKTFEPNRDERHRQCGDGFSVAELKYVPYMRPNTSARDVIGCNLKCVEIRYCHGAIYRFNTKRCFWLTESNRRHLWAPAQKNNDLVTLRTFCSV